MMEIPRCGALGLPLQVKQKVGQARNQLPSLVVYGYKIFVYMYL